MQTSSALSLWWGEDLELKWEQYLMHKEMTELKGYLGQGPARLQLMEKIPVPRSQAVRICTESKPIRGRGIKLQEIVTKLELICLTSILHGRRAGFLRRCVAQDDRWGTKIPGPGFQALIGPLFSVGFSDRLCVLKSAPSWGQNGGWHLISMWRHFFRNLQQRNQPISATKYFKTIIYL